MVLSWTKWTLAAAGILIALLPVGVSAQDADVVVVASGDRIRGDVRRLHHGRLAFRTLAGPAPGGQRWAGTISIVWTEVVSLTSAQPLVIELTSGERFTGSIASSSPGHLVVETASGPTPPIPMTRIVGIFPVEDGFRARTTGSLDFGLSLSNAQDARTYTLNGEATHRSEDYLYDTHVVLSSWLSARTGADTLTRNDVAADVRRWLPHRWFGIAKARLQQDEHLDLDLRFAAGAGAGRMLWKSNSTVLLVQGGLAYNAENYHNRDTDHSAEAVAGVQWDWFESGSTLEASFVADTYVSLARARARLDLEAAIRRDIVWDLYWAVNVFERFDGDPPNDRPRSDFALSMTLGWVF